MWADHVAVLPSELETNFGSTDRVRGDERPGQYRPTVMAAMGAARIARVPRPPPPASRESAAPMFAAITCVRAARVNIRPRANRSK